MLLRTKYLSQERILIYLYKLLSNHSLDDMKSNPSYLYQVILDLVICENNKLFINVTEPLYKNGRSEKLYNYLKLPLIFQK